MARELKKKNRKQFKFTDQVAGMLADNSESLDESENELAATAIFLYLSDPLNFVCCPKCHAHLFEKQKLLSGGIAEKKCRCGNHIVFDIDAEKYLKGKK